MTKGLSVTAYARHRGVSHVAVLKAVKAGRIVKEADGSIDPDKADAAWTRNTNQAQQRKPAQQSEIKSNPYEAEAPISPPIVNSGPNYAQSRAIKEAYHARLAKLSYEEKSGALVRTDNVKVAWFNVLRVLRDRALNLPDRLAPLLAAENDPKVLRDLLDDEIRQILNDAADAVTTISNA